MNITLNQVNLLPIRTWKWLGVSGTAMGEEIPDEFAAWEPQALNLPQEIKQDAAAFNGAEQIETDTGKDAEQFVLQNQNAGIHLIIEGNAKGPITAEYVLDTSYSTLADYNTTYVKENSRTTLVLSYRSQGSVGVFRTSLIRIVAECGAHVRLVQVQLFDDNALYFDDVGAIGKGNAVVEVIRIELGARKISSGCEARLGEYHGRFEAETTRPGNKSRITDMNYVAQCIGKETESEIHTNGVLLDESQRICRDTIDFLRGAACSVGHESEYTLLFGPKVRNHTASLILYGEGNVEGQHAASIGKVDPGKLLYLMSRGLPEPQAKQIVIEVQLTPALEKIPAETLWESIHGWLEKRTSST